MSSLPTAGTAGAETGQVPNASRLLWAGFTAILAAGLGFAIRNGILDNWGRDFGFSDAEKGAISGAGFTGFCFGIIIGGVIVDRIGYGLLVAAAFLLHVVSALVTFSAPPLPGAGTPEAIAAAKLLASNILFWGTFLFGAANGTLEAVANPLVATAFPRNRTHYLNILHASWPAGMILGGVIGWVLDDKYKIDWRYQLLLYLIPTAVYGLMFLGQRFPRSEASQKGLSLGQMLKDVGILGGAVACYLIALFFQDVFGKLPVFAERPEVAQYLGYGIGGALLLGVAVLTNFSLGHPLLFVLFVAHALVGAVELGTDGWLPNITGNILTSEQGKFLFVLTSAVMFILRFTAEAIEKKAGISPVGILLICAVLACVGLNLTSRTDTFVMMALALTVYGVGKTFFWPTMLAVASDRFPRTGAVAISIMGGIGMMSAGLLGGPGLGYAKDRFSGEALREANAPLYEANKADKPSKFLFFDAVTAIDGQKLGVVQKKINDTRESLATEGNSDPQAAALTALTPDERALYDASTRGDRKTLVADSAVPAAMAVIYLLLLLYFAAIGGYRPVQIEEREHDRDLPGAVKEEQLHPSP